MRLPTWLWPLLAWARHAASRLQSLAPAAPRSLASRDRASAQATTLNPGPLDFTDHTPLAQPDQSSCGSSVLVLMRLLRDPAFATQVLRSPDPVGTFGVEALATRRRTNSWRDRFGRRQLAWPESLGTRPAALIRELGGHWTNRVIDPAHPAAAYEVLLAADGPVPMFIGDGSWMQHIVLVTDTTPTSLTIYDPACGQRVIRSREQFLERRLDVAGWQQPWLLIVPRPGRPANGEL